MSDSATNVRELDWDEFEGPNGSEVQEYVGRGRRYGPWSLVVLFVLAGIGLWFAEDLGNRARMYENSAKGLSGFANDVEEIEAEENPEIQLAKIDSLIGFGGIEAEVRAVDFELARMIGDEWTEVKRLGLLSRVHTDGLKASRELAEGGFMDLESSAGRFESQSQMGLAVGALALLMAFGVGLLGFRTGNGRVVIQSVYSEQGSGKSGGLAFGEVDGESGLQDLPVPYCRFSNDAKILVWNRAMEELMGLSAEKAVGGSLMEIAGWSSLGDMAKTTFYRLFSGEPYDGMEWRFQHPGGEYLNLSASIVPIKDSAGTVSGGYAVFRDLTALKRQESLLVNSDMAKSAMLTAIPDSLMRFDHEGRLVEMRDNAHLFGEQGRQLVGSVDWADHTPEGFGDLIWKGLSECLVTRQSGDYVFSGAFDGSMRHLSIKLVPCGRSEVLLVLQDVGSRVRIQEAEAKAESLQMKLAQMATTDTLTGAMNYQAMVRYLGAGAQYAGQGGGLCLVLVDIDGFKEINEKQGFEVGDGLLCQLADMILGSAGENDGVGRQSGEEFLWVMPDKSLEDGQRVLDGLMERWALQNPDVTLSCGVLIVKGTHLEVKEMVTAVEGCLGEAQMKSGNSYCGLEYGKAA